MFVINKVRFLVFVLALLLAGCAGQAGNQPPVADRGQNANARPNSALPEGQAKLGVPEAIAAEHKELHEQLEHAIKAGGKTGDAAKAVEERLSEHFKKEEEYALPQLGILAELAEGRISPEFKKAIEFSDKLKAEMPTMRREHKAIVEALDALKKAAAAENNKQAAEFAEKLGHHAENEEEVMYPAAILVGEYLKLARP